MNIKKLLLLISILLLMISLNVNAENNSKSELTRKIQCGQFVDFNKDKYIFKLCVNGQIDLKKIIACKKVDDVVRMGDCITSEKNAAQIEKCADSRSYKYYESEDDVKSDYSREYREMSEEVRDELVTNSFRGKISSCVTSDNEKKEYSQCSDFISGSDIDSNAKDYFFPYSCLDKKNREIAKRKCESMLFKPYTDDDLRKCFINYVVLTKLDKNLSKVNLGKNHKEGVVSQEESKREVVKNKSSGEDKHSDKSSSSPKVKAN